MELDRRLVPLVLPRQQRQIGAVVLWRRRQQHLVVQSPIGAAPWQPRRGTSLATGVEVILMCHPLYVIRDYPYETHRVA